MDISKEQKKQEAEDKKLIEKEKEPKEKTAQEKKEEETQKEVDNNVKIRVMPRKYKTITSNSGGKQSKVIGFVIIGVGFVIMVALIVGAYFYLIKPQTSTDEPVVVKKTETPIKKENTTTKPTTDTKEKESTTKNSEEDKTSDKEDKEKEEGMLFVDNMSSSTEEEMEEEASSTEEEMEEASTTPEEILPEEAILIVVTDSDNDGLFDSEELLLGSDSSLSDTDGDGYDDLSEVLGLYNPINTDKLYANPSINKYDNEYLKYSLLYPKSWRVSVVGNNDSVVFTVGDGSFINLIVQPNYDNLGIVSWLKDLLPETEISEDDVVTGKGWSGIYHDNQKIFYLTDNNKKNVFIFDYSPAKEDYLDYYNIFKVMINSFEFED